MVVFRLRHLQSMTQWWLNDRWKCLLRTPMIWSLGFWLHGLSMPTLKCQPPLGEVWHPSASATSSSTFPWFSHGFSHGFSILMAFGRFPHGFFQGQRRFPVDHHRPQEPHLGSQRARRKDGPSSNGHRELQTAGCWGDCSCEVKGSVCYAVKIC